MTSETVGLRGALSVVADALPRLRGANAKVGRYILTSPNETINTTITDLASRVGVSEASVVRFAQSLGYAGFHALKLRLAEDIVSPRAIVHEDLSPDDEPVVAAHKALIVGLRSLEDTIHILDMAAIRAVIRALSEARHVVVFASGNSAPIAADLTFRLTKIGLHALFSADATTQEMHAAVASPDDVAVGISHTGSSKDTVHALHVAKESGARTVSITNHSRSPLTHYGDLQIVAAARASHVHDERLDSSLAMLALIEALFVGVYWARADATERAVFQTLRATDHRKY